MQKTHFTLEKDGFYGSYWPCNTAGSNNTAGDTTPGAAMIVMLGDDSDDHLAKTGVRWLKQFNINAMTMSAGKKDYGYHNYPLERVEAAIAWLKAHGSQKIGIAGASTTGTLALVAASYFPDITLTVAMTPSDFVWQGFMQGNKDGCKEWPVPGESLFSYQGKPLPYLPFAYQHPDYWHLIQSESKKNGDMINSFKLFDDSEKAHPLTDDEMIKVENIKGKLLLVGAADDALWDTTKYIRRMQQRLNNKPHDCEVEALVYEHGTHFVFPQSMLTMAVPLISNIAVKMCFSAAKKYPQECKETRIDIDKKLRSALQTWAQSRG